MRHHGVVASRGCARICLSHVRPPWCRAGMDYSFDLPHLATLNVADPGFAFHSKSQKTCATKRWFGKKLSCCNMLNHFKCCRKPYTETTRNCLQVTKTLSAPQGATASSTPAALRARHAAFKRMPVATSKERMVASAAALKDAKVQAFQRNTCSRRCCPKACQIDCCAWKSIVYPRGGARRPCK